MLRFYILEHNEGVEMGIALVFLTFFIWSTSFTIGKTTLQHGPPLFLTGTRMFVAGIIILSFLWVFRRNDFKLSKHHFFPIFMLALTSVYLTNAFEFWGLQYLTSAKACFIYSLSPFLAAFFSYIQFKERMSPKKWLGLAIGFVGFFPVLLQQSSAEELLGGILFLSWAEIALIGATITSVYGWVLLRKLGKDEGVPPSLANGCSMVLGGGFALIHSMLTEGWGQTSYFVPVTGFAGFLQGILLMILVSNLVCYNLYGWLLKRFTATFLSFAGLMTPLFAAFFGWLILKERVDWTFFLSLIIISFGLWLVYAEELRLGYIFKKAPRQTS